MVCILFISDIILDLKKKKSFTSGILTSLTKFNSRDDTVTCHCQRNEEGGKMLELPHFWAV